MKKRSAPRRPGLRPTPALPPEKALLGAMLLGASLGWAQTGETAQGALSTVVVEGQSSVPTAKSSLRATQSGIGKGQQALRDIPQTVTVMTEKLMDDRNLDDLRQVLKTTSGVSFQAGETGEEDVRLRGFSLQQAGDIYVDGLRDAPLVERDTFHMDRVEVLKGSASMLFGKGSTGGVVNQVSKQPFLMDQHEVNTTVGSGNELRVTGDFNWQTGENAALRLNLVQHDAQRWGAAVHKKGVAPTLRWGIGLRDEFSVGLYHLETDGRPIYNHPWVISNGQIQPTLPAKNFYGLASDHLRTQTDFLTLSHLHRFAHDSQLKTTLRHGHYERDLWASTVAFCNGSAAGTSANALAQQAACPGQAAITALSQINPGTVLYRSPKGRSGSSDLTQLQTELSQGFEALGKKHALIAGAEFFQEDARRNTNTATGYTYYGSTSSPSPVYTTTVGTPKDGETWGGPGTVAMNTFRTHSLGLYAQDTVSLSQTLKLLGGLRLDHFKGSYRGAASGEFSLDQTLLSPRLGLLYQPDDTRSFYASYGTSYNTSGDTYQYATNLDFTSNSAQAIANRRLLNTPPEKSRNFELGGKFELFDKRSSLGLALFHSEKYNERNTDEPTADSFLLSGKRHATGVELNFAGRISPAWELFYNHTWIALARIDQGAGTGNAQQAGDRPALTPVHSASAWSTWRVEPAWRVGLGLNHRGEQSPEGNRTVKAPAFTTVDAMAEHRVSENTSLKLNVSNLTNKLYADTLYRGFYAPGAPRLVQLSLKTLF